MTRRLPTSTLFPYTTLFRSLPTRGHSPPGRGLRRQQAPCTARDGEDRKSTRLNSSHRCISYAVFCLKKKRSPTTCLRCGAIVSAASSRFLPPATRQPFVLGI